MKKVNFKELFGIIIFCLINTVIAFYITNLLGISNTVVIKSYSAIYGDMSWEVILFLAMGLIEATVYEKIIIKE